MTRTYSQEYFKSSFLPALLKEWFHLDPSIKNSETVNVFKQKLLPFIRPLESSIFNIFHPEKSNLLTCLRCDFSHLKEHNIWHNYQDSWNSLCTCSLETENTSHYLLHWPDNCPFRADLTNSVKTFIIDFEAISDSKKVEILLYGYFWYNDDQNNSMLSASINYIKKTKRLDCSFFD